MKYCYRGAISLFAFYFIGSTGLMSLCCTHCRGGGGAIADSKPSTGDGCGCYRGFSDGGGRGGAQSRILRRRGNPFPRSRIRCWRHRFFFFRDRVADPRTILYNHTNASITLSLTLTMLANVSERTYCATFKLKIYHICSLEMLRVQTLQSHVVNTPHSATEAQTSYKCSSAG